MFAKSFKSKRKVRKKSRRLRKWLFIIFGGGLLLALIIVAILYALSRSYKEQAEVYDLSLINEVELPSIIYDRNNRELGRIFTQNRDPIQLTAVPKIFMDTLIANEDERFWYHEGFDKQGIGRVLFQMLTRGRSVSGGASTITQQLARNAFHLQEWARKNNKSTIERKAVEIFLAMRIEKRYMKEEILQFYINRVNFGGGFYGLRSASLGYFGKEPRDLELHECASIVGAIRNPAHYAPTSGDGTENIKVRNRALVRMHDAGVLSTEEMQRAMKKPLELNPKPIKRGTSHYHLRIATEMEKVLHSIGIDDAGIQKGGFRVFTTMDKEVQETMEKQMQASLNSIEERDDYKHDKHKDYVRNANSKPNYLQGAGLMLDVETGGVIAYMGGRDFVDSQYDFVQSGSKPLGTAFFPFIYAAALENGMSVAEPLIDEAMDNRRVMIDGVEGILGEWGLESLNPKYEGKIPMRRGLSASKIAATVRLARKIGLKKIWNLASKFGFRAPEKLLNRTLLGSEDASLTDVVESYAAFANGGKKIEHIRWFDRIEDLHGNVVYQTDYKQTNATQVISANNAFLIHTMLKDSLRTGSGADTFKTSGMDDFAGGGKTGTTSDFSDHWFIGYNAKVVCGLWAGFLEGRRSEIYDAAFSRETVMPVWIEAMRVAEKNIAHGEIKQPEGVVKRRICKYSGKLETARCEEMHRDPVTGEISYKSTGYEEYFSAKSYPRGYCPIHGSAITNFQSLEFQHTELTPEERLNIVPIKPKGDAVLGEDPYHAKQAQVVTVEKSIYTAGRGLNALDLDQLDKVNEETVLPLPDDIKIEIID